MPFLPFGNRYVLDDRLRKNRAAGWFRLSINNRRLIAFPKILNLLVIGSARNRE